MLLGRRTEPRLLELVVPRSAGCSRRTCLVQSLLRGFFPWSGRPPRTRRSRAPVRFGGDRARRQMRGACVASVSAAVRATVGQLRAGPDASNWPSAQARATSSGGSRPGSAPSARGSRAISGLQPAMRVTAAQQAQTLRPSTSPGPRRGCSRPASRRAARSARPSGGSLAAPRQHLCARLLHQLGRGALVDGLEMRRDPGLEREPPQQRAAQRVDGHDAEPARQVEHPREQAPRAAERSGVGGAPVSASSSAARPLVAAPPPSRQPLLDPQPSSRPRRPW